MNLTTEYLERLASIETPPQTTIYNDERDEQCGDYCELRNAAKDLLDDSKDVESRERLLTLIEKLGIE